VGVWGERVRLLLRMCLWGRVRRSGFVLWRRVEVRLVFGAWVM
jgi:hypothetical protein